MKFAPHYLKRYKDIGILLLRYSETGLNSRFGNDETNLGLNRRTHKASGEHDQADQLPLDLERLGPTFVKLGQLLSSRPDLVPARYLKPLSRLQDRVKPFPLSDVEMIIESELGTRINKAFSSFEPEPLAAASLGQVHFAKLHDGREVVVKVQRPNIRKTIEDDFAALEEIAAFLGRHTKMGQKYQFSKVLEEFQASLVNELDYRREASNMVNVGRNLAEFRRIKVPRPINDYTTQKVLTMEYIEGRKITKLSPLARLDIDGPVLAEELFRAYLQQILIDGLFHADPHPGNIFLTDDHQIALLDLGMVGHTTPGMQEDLLKLLLAVSEGEGDEAAEVAIHMSTQAGGFDEAGFRQKIGRLVAEQQNAKLSQLDTGRVILDVSQTAADTGLYVPTELSLLGKTLLQLDEAGRTLAPDFNPNESIRRNAAQILNQRLKGAFSEGKMYSTLLEGKQFLGALPSRLNKILDALGNAELNVNVKPEETEFLLESAQKVANRITAGLVLAALIVGAALLMQVNTKFTVLGYPGFAMICFLVAAGMGFWLVINILFSDHKSKRKSRG
jgi:predicted unusual protein kinase regulating ubiquinone biosynthesis (AarF/ABC1/UbiB family)